MHRALRFYLSFTFHIPLRTSRAHIHTHTHTFSGPGGEKKYLLRTQWLPCVCVSLRTCAHAPESRSISIHDSLLLCDWPRSTQRSFHTWRAGELTWWPMNAVASFTIPRHVTSGRATPIPPCFLSCILMCTGTHVRHTHTPPTPHTDSCISVHLFSIQCLCIEQREYYVCSGAGAISTFYQWIMMWGGRLNDRTGFAVLPYVPLPAALLFGDKVNWTFHSYFMSLLQLLFCANKFCWKQIHTQINVCTHTRTHTQRPGRQCRWMSTKLRIVPDTFLLLVIHSACNHAFKQANKHNC